jgi:hypothetical protein
MATDRDICKGRETGVRATYGLANANGAYLETIEIHSRSHHFQKLTSEIANANAAEFPGFTVDRKSKLKTFKGVVGTGITQNTTDYVIVTIAKRTAGGAATTIATYNTHNSAQGTITAWSPFSFSVVANSDSTLADGDAVTCTVTKVANGAALNSVAFSADVEEV